MKLVHSRSLAETLDAVNDAFFARAKVSKAEKRFAAPACERLLARRPTGEQYNRRRRAVAEGILAQV